MTLERIADIGKYLNSTDVRREHNVMWNTACELLEEVRRLQKVTVEQLFTIGQLKYDLGVREKTDG